MTAFTTADKLHRLVKHALDSGAAASIADAEALFAGYRLALRISEDAARDRHHQAALLTAVALARRVFLGGVRVAPLPDAPLLTPLPFGTTLAEAVTVLGGSIAEPEAGTPVIEIGGTTSVRRAPFHVRAIFAGWRGGIVPAPFEAAPVPAPVMALAPMLAAALAVNEAFLYVSGHVGVAGRRTVGLSLWNPASTCDWLGDMGTEPIMSLLPAQLWLIGLGHLGQAFLWALGLLPFARPQDLNLVLQDIDIITPSTESTSILSDATLINIKKTRAMAAWAERRGFSTVVQERLFDASFRRQDGEPAVALCGLDNGVGRQALDQVGFDFVVEAGLGRGHQDFRAVRLHTMPASRPASQIWRDAQADDQVEDRPAYQGLLASGALDRCGVTLLAGKAVGAPFVGATAATLALSEVLRLLHGGTVHELIDLDLKAVEYRCTVPTLQNFSTLNPGYVMTDERHE
ncbi:hypothetical protein [Reyranella sp.]|jgi:hypothetical protein|uniref:hypothetical protein n=1 Tax=Reyranella sp. TaxID=1929291 RepID=UPI000BDB2249|nr:hypothetical protein [Reyranella sp.]OYY40121.1 MAG: hypothetical protein B7Y57_18590 [Rhodospirillales bacterium 35-66-84]OYZ92530.1 MAG: hypothetical protein B7Y08_21185 [Rhodospirillales bacterium 24-66-33]OZB23838.1 MAG: hypothetical protein B7X63_18050 [Rhodospirillales bacterium 39-66-50]HQS16985.1 hypothetical protein [Reyranella sp.]HQT15044.1 hypothetical protein [Reyranella sp.]